MPIVINVDVSEVKRGIANMAKAHLWGPIIINRAMTTLGQEGVVAMKETVHPHRYRGILEDSIKFQYNSAIKELSIGPTAKRRGFNAGDILESGTTAIRNVPWQPIRMWGLARGLNIKQIYGVWKKIREHGISPHPFVERTVQGSRFQFALEKASNSIAREMAVEVFKGESGTGLLE